MTSDVHSAALATLQAGTAATLATMLKEHPQMMPQTDPAAWMHLVDQFMLAALQAMDKRVAEMKRRGVEGDDELDELGSIFDKMMLAKKAFNDSYRGRGTVTPAEFGPHWLASFELMGLPSPTIAAGSN